MEEMKKAAPGRERWLLWRDGARSPAMNMAVDELLLEEALELGKPVLRLYGWDRPAASYGYSQGPAAVRREGLALVRRPTGGGAVYHDVDLTYTVVIPAGHELSKLDRMESYQVLHEAVLMAVESLGVKARLESDDVAPHDRATLQCFVSPSPRDVVSATGKLAGAAQRRTRQGILHQGSIALSAGPSPEAIAGALIEACAKRFSAELAPFEASAKLLERAAKLANLKYESEAWNIRKESPPPGWDV